MPRGRGSLRCTAVLVLSAYLVGMLPQVERSSRQRLDFKRDFDQRDLEKTMLRITFAAALPLWRRSARPRRRRNAAGPSDSARYTFHRVQDDFLRLDLHTGQVSQCGWAAIGWYCRVVPDERTALESEIARLQTSNIALKRELVARGLAVAGRDQARSASFRRRQHRIEIAGRVSMSIA